ncbi:embryonic stem cell-specific 5-hydroxymethylcytosine-binding protein isoform X1 [Panicum hallii]|uniref:embryonic stem cell-specific 5-hydroxymethylcytosine-binding protein isoform X1 n=1 Tax=Panicum hallii TaxID=206008 RepID=UPI000DF4DF6A|nr:embryonic stem cell-specific 5-hydroxymethylcytosine-binding protein isoform X1 [Panicum hallii]
MCGRARCTLSAAQAARAFGFPTTTAAAGPGGGAGDAPAVRTLDLDRFRPSYNVSPGAYLPVGTVRAQPAAGGDGGRADDGAEPVIQCMKWGLVPSFTGKTEKPDHFRMFNARSESVKEKASFRRLIPKNRCLVAVEGFYEWKKDGSKKQPYYIHFQDHRPLVFAALYDTWTNSEGEIIHTFTILTTRASTSLKWLHDRMPVILGDNDSVNAWLNDASVKLEEITAPYEGADLVWYPVTPAMGKTSFDGPECIKEFQVRMGPSEKPISKFFTKKSTAHDQSVKPEKTTSEFAETHASRASKVECDESVENQPEDVNQQKSGEKQTTSSTVKDEPVSLEHQVFGKPQSIKDEDTLTSTDITIGKQDDLGIKRKIKDTEVKAEMENSGWSRSQPTTTKKAKGAKVASDGQPSLLSYFARK